MDMSRAEYDAMTDKTYALENAEALKSALGKLEERKREAGIITKPTEYYAVQQMKDTYDRMYGKFEKQERKMNLPEEDKARRKMKL